MYFKAIATLSMVILSVDVVATPLVKTVEAAEDSSKLIISGSNFGIAPSVELYEHFEADSASEGAVVNIESALQGAWTSISKYYQPTYSPISRTGKYSGILFSADTNRAHIMLKQFSKPTQEVFLSYWVKLSEGSFFPGDVVSAPSTFPDDSSWKFAWLIDQDVSGKNADLCLPTHVGRGNFWIAGNSHNAATLDNSWWSWKDWMRISVWLKANPSNPVEPGRLIFQAVSKDKGFYQKEFSTPIFPNNGHLPKQFQYLNINGWSKGTKDPSTKVFYDDIYLAIGAGAVSRVEIGRSGVYKDNAELHILPVKSWSAGVIEVDIPSYYRESLAGYYVFVTDDQARTNEIGIPLSSPPEQVKGVKLVL